MVKSMVARGGIGLLLGLVLGPPFLNGGSVLGEVVDAVFGLANLVVRGTLEKLVSFGFSVIVNAVLPRLGVGVSPP